MAGALSLLVLIWRIPIGWRAQHPDIGLVRATLDLRRLFRCSLGASFDICLERNACLGGP